MKAITCKKYGPPDVLKVEEVPKPVPGEDEILVKIHATTVTSGDVRIRGADFPALVWLPMRLFMGFGGPRNPILGGVLSGVVESVGSKVTLFRPGDEIFASTFEHGMGSYAEYKCLPQDAVIAPKPANLTFEEAACLFFGGHAALHFLRKGNVRPGQDVLVYGASGAVGVAAVQLAKHFGGRVTGVTSTANLELVDSLGAERVIDYTREDFTRSGEKYDIIFDTVGESPFSGSVNSLKEDGIYLRSVHLTLSAIMGGIWTGLTTGKKVIGGVAQENTEVISFLGKLAESGELKPVIDRRFPLEEIVEAHRYVQTGHKRGSVVISILKEVAGSG